MHGNMQCKSLSAVQLTKQTHCRRTTYDTYNKKHAIQKLVFCRQKNITEPYVRRTHRNTMQILVCCRHLFHKIITICKLSAQNKIVWTWLFVVLFCFVLFLFLFVLVGFRWIAIIFVSTIHNGIFFQILYSLLQLKIRLLY